MPDARHDLFDKRSRRDGWVVFGSDSQRRFRLVPLPLLFTRRSFDHVELP